VAIVLPLSLHQFRTIVRRKEATMIALLSLAGLYAGWRAGRAVWDTLRRLPRSNDDFVFF
jgi:hypothetical protein